MTISVEMKSRDLAWLVDDFDKSLARIGRTEQTRLSYRWTLNKLLDEVGRDPVALTVLNLERFFDRWAGLEPATMAQRMAAVAAFTRWLVQRGVVAFDPMASVARAKRRRPELLDVVTVSTEDVRRLFAAVRSRDELLALALGVSTGARRSALAQLRWRDVDFANVEIRFRWKGGGVQSLAMTDELRLILEQAQACGELDTSPNSYVIPNRQPSRVSRAERDDRIVWRLVRDVAARAGVRAHVHALRGAFSVYALEHGGLDLMDVREALGHARLESTAVYLRRLERTRSISKMRAMSWSLSAPAE